MKTNISVCCVWCSLLGYRERNAFHILPWIIWSDLGHGRWRPAQRLLPTAALLHVDSAGLSFRPSLLFTLILWVSSSISTVLITSYMLTMLKLTYLIKVFWASAPNTQLDLWHLHLSISLTTSKDNSFFISKSPKLNPIYLIFFTLGTTIYSISQALSLISSLILPLYKYPKFNSLII